jgi:D-serine deaminase-like pyridoxal phosphate-dependent protein
MAELAAEERAALLVAVARLTAAGLAPGIISAGASPTAMHGADFSGITELRAGVYMFGDLLQAQLGVHPLEDVAVSVLTSVIGRYPARGAVLVDAGALALSKDRSTEAAPRDWGFGRVLDRDGVASLGDALVTRVHQEHGEGRAAGGLDLGGLDLGGLDLARLPVGTRLRIVPNHSCLTAAAHSHYQVLEEGRLVASWARVNGW